MTVAPQWGAHMKICGWGRPDSACACGWGRPALFQRRADRSERQPACRVPSPATTSAAASVCGLSDLVARVPRETSRNFTEIRPSYHQMGQVKTSKVIEAENPCEVHSVKGIASIAEARRIQQRQLAAKEGTVRVELRRRQICFSAISVPPRAADGPPSSRSLTSTSPVTTREHLSAQPML